MGNPLRMSKALSIVTSNAVCLACALAAEHARSGVSGFQFIEVYRDALEVVIEKASKRFTRRCLFGAFSFGSNPNQPR